MCNNFFKSMALLVICLVLANIIEGCSIIGFTIGTVMDEAATNKIKAEPWLIGSFREGRTMTIYLRDGSKIKGGYKGLFENDYLSYAAKYAKCEIKSIPGITLPVLKDSLSVVVDKTTYRDNCFAGFGYEYRKSRSKEQQEQGVGCYYLNMTMDGLPENRRFYMDNVWEIVSSNGDSIRGYVINELIKRGEVPISTEARFITDLGMTNLNLEDIEFIESKKKNGKLLGFGIGLFFDFVFAIIIGQEL